ncbi:MAG: hypothetical protein DCE92_02480 [Alphaproteobacteria bacterium]|nr:MAG: hypothetical protein DCE92_02480 [Alphaproteobacteria bacterium]
MIVGYGSIQVSGAQFRDDADGVVVGSVEAGSRSAVQNLRAGDRVRSINKVPVADLAALGLALGTLDGTAELGAERNGTALTVTLGD